VESLKLDTQQQDPAHEGQQVFNGRLNPGLVCVQEPNSPAAECFKVLRSKLLVSESGQLVRTIMVTGVQPMDGKSLVSANLAVSIAQGINQYVLLVDCDLRRPSLHTSFGLRPKHGLRDYLEGGESVAPYLLKTSVPKLTLLPAGRPLASPSELLGSEKMKILIKELRDRYQDRFIIIDTPPAHFTAEASPLFSMMDGVLLVVRAGKTALEPIKEVIAGFDRGKILGVVFNASQEVQKDYRYYYRYYQSGKKK
jgi:exopolysaccharide/PEP-CTERM locus tyrosine autokinase